jgi:hypothetical protein
MRFIPVDVHIITLWPRLRYNCAAEFNVFVRGLLEVASCVVGGLLRAVQSLSYEDCESRGATYDYG